MVSSCKQNKDIIINIIHSLPKEMRIHMIKLFARQISEAVKGKIIWGDKNIEITDVKTDSRTISHGHLFIPLIGERYDAHEFIPQVYDAGASAILTDRESAVIEGDAVFILVDDTKSALGRLAAWYRDQFDIPVIAITGSCGKTSTKDMIYSVLSQKFITHRTIGNYNNDIGLPLTIMGLKKSHEVIILEMGMNHAEEIHYLADIARPTMGIITNIGVSHIEYLGSRENILNAKMEIFDFFEGNEYAIINGDDDMLATIDMEGTKTSYYGIEGRDLNYRAENIIKNNDSTEFTVNNNRFFINVPGEHNVLNSLAAIAAGRHLSMDWSDIIEGLKTYKGAEMRLNVIKSDNSITIIDDAYNASPDSVNAALKLLSTIEEGRKIAILGDMFEMGSYAEWGHKSVGEMVHEYDVDILMAVGPESYNIALRAVEIGMDEEHVYYSETIGDLIDIIDYLIMPGDNVLVKGSRGMKMEVIVKYLQDIAFT